MRKYLGSIIFLATLFLFPALSVSQGSIGTQFGSDVDGEVAQSWVPKKAAAIRNGIYYPEIVTGAQISAFGEAVVTTKSPQAQIRYQYGIVHPDLGQTLSNKAGSSVTVASAMATVTASSTAESFSQLRTLDSVRYGPGQGVEFLGTCLFSEGVALSTQLFGMGDDDEGFFFGYNGVDFAILIRSFGSLEIKDLTITGVADADGGDFTITLDGTAVTVTVASNATIAQITSAIKAVSDDFSNAGRGWEVYTGDNVSISFISFVAENAAGSFAFADVDSGVTAGAFSESVAGVAPTDSWVNQEDWNVDPMDGTGPSGMVLDQTKGNVYKIVFQYLGFGAVNAGIENPETGLSQVVHILKYANSNIIPTLQDPTLRLTMITKTEVGYSGPALSMKSASMSGFLHGEESREGVRRSFGQEKSMTTTEQVLMIIENPVVFNSKRNKVYIYPDFISAGSESTKATILRLYQLVDEVTGGVALANVNAGISVVKTGQTGTSIVGGERVLPMIFVGGDRVNLRDFNFKIPPGRRIVVTGQLSSGSPALVDFSMTWTERH